MAKRKFPVLTVQKRKRVKSKPLPSITSLRAHTRKGQIIWDTSNLCTYLVPPHESIKRDLPGVCTRIYAERHRVYQGELCGKGPCIAFWVSGNLMIQLDPALAAIAPEWLQAGTRVDLASIDLTGMRSVNYFVKYLVPLDPCVLPSWPTLASIPPNCIPSGFRISCDFALASVPLGKPSNKSKAVGVQMLDMHGVQESNWHLVFLEHGIVRLLLPKTDFGKVWNRLIARLPNLVIGDEETLHKWHLELMIPTFPIDYLPLKDMPPADLPPNILPPTGLPQEQLPFKLVRRLVKSTQVCSGAQLTDVATGCEIGIVTSASSSGYGIALVDSEFSQEQCVLVNIGTQRPQTAQTAHILPMPR